MGVADRGNRRIDRVLDENYLAGLRSLPLAELRALREEAEQEEVDVSYLRRVLQGRIDIVHAELRRRESGQGGSLVEDLPNILADAPRGPARGLGRHTTVQPSRADAHRRYVEALVADVDLSDVTARSDDELRRVSELLEREERDVSEKRRAVQRVVDECSAEVARRYRDGEADVSQLLEERPQSG